MEELPKQTSQGGSVRMCAFKSTFFWLALFSASTCFQQRGRQIATLVSANLEILPPFFVKKEQYLFRFHLVIPMYEHGKHYNLKPAVHQVELTCT